MVYFQFYFVTFDVDEQFRSQLLDVEKENTGLKRKVEELEDRLRERDSEYSRLSKKIKLMERDNDVLTRTAQTYEAQARDLEREVGNHPFITCVPDRWARLCISGQLLCFGRKSYSRSAHSLS